MSTKLRYILKLGGGYYGGGTVAKVLEGQLGIRPHGREEMISAAQRAGAYLWVFREPRSVDVKRSRYKKVAKAYMFPWPRLARRKKAAPQPMEDWAAPAMPQFNLQGVLNGANPPVGLAPQGVANAPYHG